MRKFKTKGSAVIVVGEETEAMLASNMPREHKIQIIRKMYPGMSVSDARRLVKVVVDEAKARAKALVEADEA